MLWRSLWGSLLPLYAILLPVPDAVRRWHIGSFHGSQGPLSYIEYIHKVLDVRSFDDSAIWTSFLRCASRIRHILDWDPGFDLRVLRVLCDRNGEKTILPSLQSLSWADDPGCRSDEALPLLAPPSLRHMIYRVDSVTPIEFVGTTLANVLSKAPYLSSLTILVDERLSRRLSLLPFLSHFQQLRRLALSGWQVVTPSSFTDFSSSLTLEHLDCHLEGFEGNQNIESALEVPNLMLLKLTGTRSVMQGFLRSLRAPRVRELDLTVWEPDPEHGHCANADLCGQIAGAQFSHTLQRLILRFRGPLDNAAAQGHLSDSSQTSLSAIVRPLLSLKSLRHFTLHYLWKDTALTDATMTLMAEAWPGIEELMLSMRETAPARSPRPTPLSLSKLSLLCPNLRVLSIPIDLEHADAGACTPAPNDCETTPGRSRPHPLKKLDILGQRCLTTPEAELMRFAQFLHRLFPCLVPRSPVTYALMVDRWEIVWDKFRSLSAMALERGEVDAGAPSLFTLT
ncbi:hypothetical protein BD309DRAFT_991232 [Dichomitus squalens]|nr:hypothetical protein BD309DRAFT_991232 [Dichomitus squalens]